MSLPPVDPSLTIKFPLRPELNTTRVVSYRIPSGYTVSTDGFEFTIYDTDRSRLRGLEMQPVELLINGATQLIGRIDKTSIGGDGSALACYGRDYVADLVECNIDPSAVVKKGMTLGDVLTLVCAPVGIDFVISDDDLLMRNIRSGKKLNKLGDTKNGSRAKAGGKKHHTRPVDDCKPNAGEGMYEFCNRLVARFGATIQPASDRKTLIIDEPSYNQDPAYQFIRSVDDQGSAANNILDATADRDWSSFPTYALFSNKVGDAGSAPGSISAFRDIFQIAAQSPELLEIIQRATISGRWKPTDKPPITNGQLYRLLYHRDTESKTQEQIDNAVARAVAERLRETLRYSVTLRGHADPKTQAIYTPDTMADVVDEICNVNEALWLHSREFSYSKGPGALTKVECWRPFSFLLG